MGSPRRVIASDNVVGDIVEIRLRYCIYFRTNTFGKGVNPVILPVKDSILQLIFFYKDRFGMK